MIRILHLVSSLSKVSGVMNVVMNYYRNIDQNKIQFDFCYFLESENTFQEEIDSLGGKTYFFSKPGIASNYKKELTVIFGNELNKYNTLHMHEVYLTSLIGPVARKSGLKNIITHSHTTMYSDKLFSSLRNRILCLPLKKYANHYFACSIAAGEFLYGKKYLNDSRVTIINNAIRCEEYKFNEETRKVLRSKYNLENSLVLGHVGRFSEQKNHTFLIDIFKSLKKKERNVKLLLVGDGPLLSNIMNKVNDAGLENDVLFLGPRNDIPNLLSAMDIFVLPSLFEGLPVVGVEAQAAGLPIVLATTVTREIGLLNYKYIDLKESPEFWANEILKLKQDNGRNQAFQLIKDKCFSIDQEAKKLQYIYIEMNK